MASYSVRHLMRGNLQLGSKALASDGVWDRIKCLGISGYIRGTTAGVNIQRTQLIRKTTRSRFAIDVNNINKNNLMYVQCVCPCGAVVV